ncbi:MAG: hypothetical protein ACT4QC_08415 [Planctomycetaceae bacterium]
MSETLDYVRGHARIAGSAEAPADEITLTLCIDDPDTAAELGQHAAGEERERFALNALRIGVLALRQARGQIDGEQIRRESQLLLAALEKQLGTHAALVHERLAGALQEYFDPDSGRFQERVNRLVRKDGELEEVLRRQVGADGSELARTLANSFGSESPLMKLLSPNESAGFCRALREMLDEQLCRQRDTLLRQFSLDDKDSALSRLIAELGESHTELSGSLQEKIDDVVREFSLDDENSALSRLVRNVDRAQKTITSEFSFDNDSSALSRLKKLLESTQEAIDSNLTLDRDDSALSRLRKEVLEILAAHEKGNREFQSDVKLTLEKMVVQRAEAARSTRHGMAFEEAACEFVQREAQKLGDVATRTGNTTGLIKNQKIGDCVIELGPDSAAPGAKIVSEMKEVEGYQVGQARAELEKARTNRGAQIGVFVCSAKTAPAELSASPLLRYGPDILVAWNPEDPSTDLYFRTALTLARALCIRVTQHSEAQQADFQEIDQAINEIEKRAGGLGDVEKWAETIKDRSEDILERVRLNRSAIARQVEGLRKTMADLRQAVSGRE